MSYPLFVPPGDLGEKVPREWSSTEAREFYRWQLGVLEERVGNMLNYFEEELTGDAEADLRRLGEKVASVVAEPEFSYQAKTEPIVFKKGSRTLIAPPQTETEPRLTSAGLALGADMGLLVAKLLLEACGGKLKWIILKRPKSEMSYNTPVLTGLPQWPYFDPVYASIAKLSAVLQGDRGPMVWFELFDFCQWSESRRPWRSPILPPRQHSREANPPSGAAQEVKDRYLSDLVQRIMMNTESPPVDSRDSISFTACEEAARLVDPGLLRMAKTEVAQEQDKNRRRVLYLIISKIGLNIDCQDTAEFLITQLRRETDRHVLGALLDSIAELPKNSGVDLEPVLSLIGDRRWLVRHSAIKALEYTDSSAAEQALIDVLLTSSDPNDLVYANATLYRSGTARAVPAIERHLHSRKRDVRDSAESALYAIRQRQAWGQKSPS